jgi:hypothetical protein
VLAGRDIWCFLLFVFHEIRFFRIFFVVITTAEQMQKESRNFPALIFPGISGSTLRFYAASLIFTSYFGY